MQGSGDGRLQRSPFERDLDVVADAPEEDEVEDGDALVDCDEDGIEGDEELVRRGVAVDRRVHAKVAAAVV